MDRWEFCQAFGVSLDLAVEAHELLRGATQREVPGVKEEKEELGFAKVSTITIFNPEGEKALGRPRGTYVTIEVPNLSSLPPDQRTRLIRLVSDKLQLLLGRSGLLPHADVLIVGLGNRRATPDSLGPRVVERCLVTRHLHRYAPETLPPSLRSTSAIAPGVLGVTGIETLEIVRGVVEHLHPALVMVVDALAAQEVRRLGSTIQIADTGLSPGSGAGNGRGSINRFTLGRPVIALGVPTVVQAPVLFYDFYHHLPHRPPANTPNDLSEAARQVLAPFGGGLTVTPKEIDELIDHVAEVLAAGINRALFPDLSEGEIEYLT